MERIFSARIDEGVAHRISILSRRLRLPKKRVLERAVLLLSEREHGKKGRDFLVETFGAWRRREKASTLVKKAREAFRDSMERNQRP